MGSLYGKSRQSWLKINTQNDANDANDFNEFLVVSLTI